MTFDPVAPAATDGAVVSGGFFTPMGGGGSSASPMAGGGGITVAQPIGGETVAGSSDGDGGNHPECENPTCAEMIGRRCGPDVTAWLPAKIKSVIKDMQERQRSNRRYNARWEMGHGRHAPGMRNDVKLIYRAALNEWDWNNKRKGGGYEAGKGNPTSECPHLCDHTVTLCGMCVPSYVPEDLNFAIVGKAMGFYEATLRAAAGFIARIRKSNLNAVGRTVGAFVDVSANIILSGGEIGGDVAGEQTFTVGFAMSIEDLDDVERFCKKLKKPGAIKQHWECALCKDKFNGWPKKG